MDEHEKGAGVKNLQEPPDRNYKLSLHSEVCPKGEGIGNGMCVGFKQKGSHRSTQFAPFKILNSIGQRCPAQT